MAGPTTHFKNFWKQSDETLCAELTTEQETITIRPEEVTCEKCLSMMGRSQTPKDPGAASGST